MTPDGSLFVVNANVFTADEENPHADAFIVEGSGPRRTRRPATCRALTRTARA